MSVNLHSLFGKPVQFWRGLSAKAKRTIAISLGIVLTLLLISVSMPTRAPRVAKNPRNQFEFATPDLAKEVMAEKLQDQVAALNKQLSDMATRMEKMEKDGKKNIELSRQQIEQLQSGRVDKEQKQQTDEKALLNELRRGMGNSPILPGGAVNDLYAPGKPVNPENPNASPVTPQGGKPAPTNEAKQPSATTPTSDVAAPVEPSRGMGVLSSKSRQATKKEEAKAEKEKNRPSFYLPSASFFDVKLLTGLDAPTGNKAKKEPSPIAFRIQDLAFLPNEYRQNIKGCLLLAEGIGELSTERVNVRGLSISCINEQGEKVIDQKLLGYVADSDGKAGLRGTVVSKAGKLLAQTMTVGFIQGISQFFSIQARDITTSGYGGVTSTPKNSTSDALLGGVATGFGQALDKVADYYMDLAEEIFPVIQVSATRNATFVVTQGANLSFDKTLTNQSAEGARHEEL